jgi:predicted 3-demethylubiquinone-9 3-methyltransferase (glyoxalase superfamily)
MASTQKISACLWFDMQAEEAVNFYISVFKNSRIIRTSYYGKEGYEIHKMPEGTVLTIEFELEGTRFVAMNGGPLFTFSEAISFIINCENQDEIDYYWEMLTADGDPNAQQCGWLKDRYGVSWQVVPAALAEMIADSNSEKAGRVMHALMQMKKLDIKVLEDAYRGA